MRVAMDNSEHKSGVIWALPSPEAWEARDRVLAKMQQLGATREDIQRIVGPSPPRINYGLLPGSQPKLRPDPGEGWTAEWAAALQKFQIRQMATYRQGYHSCLGEFPEPPSHRTLDVDELITCAAMRLLGRQWKEMAPGVSADDLERATEATRKAVTEFLKWTRLDPASIARNRAADARRIILEIETKELDAREGSGPQLTKKEKRQLANARTAPAKLSAGIGSTERTAAKPHRPTGRPKKAIDRNRVVELRNKGTTWADIASKLKTSSTTVRRAYERVSADDLPKSANRK